jgi:oligopeptide/dipeptide ABC transporter ATP-binding protein
LSGGLRQRVMIALALSCDPKLLIADEATTALDVTTQAQILRVLRRVTTELGTAILVITHSMGVVAGLADRVAVMYAGRIVEIGTVDEIFYGALHPYTVGLLGSIPRMNTPRDAELASIEGRPPSLLMLPPGCPFADRCWLTMDRCVAEEPTLASSHQHSAACWADPHDVRAGARAPGLVSARATGEGDQR